MYSKLFLEMAYDRPTGRMSRISICAVAYNAICQAFKDLYDLYLMLVYVASRYSPDSRESPWARKTENRRPNRKNREPESNRTETENFGSYSVPSSQEPK